MTDEAPIEAALNGGWGVPDRCGGAVVSDARVRITVTLTGDPVHVRQLLRGIDEADAWAIDDALYQLVDGGEIADIHAEETLL